MKDRSIEDRLAELPRNLEPPRRVWDGVREGPGQDPRRVRLPPAGRVGLRGRAVLIVAAAVLVAGAGLGGAFIARNLQTTDLARVARKGPPDLAALYLRLDQQVRDYERAQSALLRTMEELASATGESEEQPALAGRIARVDAEIDALIADIISDPTAIYPVLELASLLAGETAALGDIRTFAAGFLN